MPTRTVTINVMKLSQVGRLLLDAGDWNGKPAEPLAEIVVPIWAKPIPGPQDIYKLWVSRENAFGDYDALRIPDDELEKLDRHVDVNSWWNEMSERLLNYLETHGLMFSLVEELDRIPTLELDPIDPRRPYQRRSQ